LVAYLPWGCRADDKAVQNYEREGEEEELPESGAQRSSAVKSCL